MSTSFSFDGKDYVLTFNDEFNGSALRVNDGVGDDDIWATTFSPGWDDLHFLAQNNERQYYVDPSRETLTSPFTMVDGKVNIKATQLTEAEQALAQGQQYSSGLLTTQMSFSATSGYVEMRADMPAQQGFWSSFWMLPLDGGWTSEIDIAEVLGHDTDTLHTNFWIEGEPDSQAVQVDGSDGFHTYGLMWTKNQVQWLYDGQVVRTLDRGLSEDMFLAISLAVGGFAGSVDGTTDFSDTMKIDYVRVYELENDPHRNAAIEFDAYTAQSDAYATSHGEILRGTQFDDEIDAGAGRDKVYGRLGDDLIDGSTGNDRLYGGGNDDHLIGGIGHDRLFGGYGHDEVHGGIGTDRMFGYSGNDLLTGGRGFDRLFGNVGDDQLFGDEQRDDLFGGKGNDQLFGGKGKDELFGNGDDDALFGGEFDDKLVGGYGSDTLDGGSGTDHIWGGTFNGDGVSDVFVFNAGNDKDVIHDFTVGVDKIDLSSIDLTWDALQGAMTDNGWATNLNLEAITGSKDDLMVLARVDAVDLTENDFILQTISGG